MYVQILFFIVASVAWLAGSRLLLVWWQRHRVRGVNGLGPVMRGGLRIDALVVAAATGVPLALAPWVGHVPAAQAVLAGWLQVVWVAMVLLEVSTPPFIEEYDTRPNQLYLVYLKHPREVGTMLWRGYRRAILGAVAALLVLAWAGHYGWAPVPVSAWNAPVWIKALSSFLALAVAAVVIRGTWRHRPINPSTVAFCGDGLVNTLPLNSLYSVLYAAYCLKNQRPAHRAYGDLPDAVIQSEVARAAGWPIPPAHAAIPTLHRHQPSSTAGRPRHLVILVEESLGAQFTGHLNGCGWTPSLDRLAAQAWHFTRAYATGTRSVRGLEALVAGFPPSLSDAVLRLPQAQRNFFTLAQLLRRHGYVNRFVYGGEAHFDNMKGFMLGNGFDTLHDLPTFEAPAFVGTWGASDEDLFRQVHALLDDAQQPTFILAFSVSNHAPWEYPSGRIEPEGEPASMRNAVRYADWALGQFVEQASASKYWADTVCLVAADHDARVGGCASIPVRHFHIPAVILGGCIVPRRDERLISQIDLPVTLLSLLGIADEHPMIGHDLTRPQAGGRAMMQYGDTYGYLRGEDLLVLQPQRQPVQYVYGMPDAYQPCEVDEHLAREALAHALWADRSCRQGLYTLPGLVGAASRNPDQGLAFSQTVAGRPR